MRINALDKLFRTSRMLCRIQMCFITWILQISRAQCGPEDGRRGDRVRSCNLGRSVSFSLWISWNTIIWSSSKDSHKKCLYISSVCSVSDRCRLHQVNNRIQDILKPNLFTYVTTFPCSSPFISRYSKFLTQIPPSFFMWGLIS